MRCAYGVTFGSASVAEGIGVCRRLSQGGDLPFFEVDAKYVDTIVTDLLTSPGLMKNTNDVPGPKKPHILLIQGTRHGLTARKAVLEEAGHMVTAMVGVAEGIDCITNQNVNLVVIADHNLPGMTGSELVAYVKKIADLPVVLISGMVETLGLTEQSTGADAVVGKTNLEVTNLNRAVNRLLRSKPPKKPVRAQAKARTLRSATPN